MNKIEIESYKLRIENSINMELNDTISEILEHKEFPGQLLDSVVQSIKDGHYITPKSLSRIVILTESKELFEIAEANKQFSTWEYIDLLEVGYIETGIEKKLGKSLYKHFKNNSEPRRRYIVEAMARFGTEVSLSLLEVIQHELEPEVVVGKIKLEAIQDSKNNGTINLELNNVVDALKLRGLVEFFQLVQNAKKEISERIQSINLNIKCPKADGYAQPPNQGEQSDALQRIFEYQKRAIAYTRSDSESSLNLCRKAAEIICKDIYTKKKVDKKPVDKSGFDDLLTKLNQKNLLPRHIYVHLTTIRDLGNWGSHDQGEESKYITQIPASRCIDALKDVVEWYIEEHVSESD